MQTNSPENFTETVVVEQASIVSHFWFCCYPGFNTQLIFYPNASNLLTGNNVIDVYDSDGALINSVKLSFAGEPIGIFDLECLVADCKLESGLKHGHLVVSSPAGIGQQCRLLSLRGGWIANRPNVVTKRKDAFFPLLFAPERSSYLALVNQSDEAADVRIRAFCGARAPKLDLPVPANGSRIFSLDTLFPEYGYMDAKSLNAYVRLGVREGGSVNCLFIERFIERSDNDFFQVIC